LTAAGNLSTRPYLVERLFTSAGVVYRCNCAYGRNVHVGTTREGDPACLHVCWLQRVHPHSGEQIMPAPSTPTDSNVQLLTKNIEYPDIASGTSCSVYFAVYSSIHSRWRTVIGEWVDGWVVRYLSVRDLCRGWVGLTAFHSVLLDSPPQR